tara:strand:- start:811 stop:1119 length:309 start_codon:yes stop_codon:yes gene_type:complete
MLSLLAVLLIPVVELASAQDIAVPPIQIDLNRSDAAPAVQTNQRVTQIQAVEIAKQRFEGNVLRISLVGQGAAQRYQIRMENEGKVFTVFVNATTGRISGGG